MTSAQQRIELKYAVPDAVAAFVYQWSTAFLQPDRGLTEPQRITSLYLDGPCLPFLQWTKQRRPYRFKLRVRGYGDHPLCTVYAEIKSRIGGQTHKQRAELPFVQLAVMLNDSDATSWLAMRGEHDPAMYDFLKRRVAFRAKPQILLTCLRQSLREGGAAGELAVTVDRSIAYQRTNMPSLLPDGREWRALELPPLAGQTGAIVEIKYEKQLPAWLRPLIINLPPYRVGFSKYKAAMLQHADWSTCNVRSLQYAMGGNRTIPSAFVRAVSLHRPGLYATE